jgi:2-amino-4-hydroxy-6-hydroxymethyldihydropteridine diphosphokinase
MTCRADVALGSNLGHRAAWLAGARAALSLLPGTRLVAASSIEETAPFGPAAQGPFLNQMVSLQTSLPPLALLHGLQAIETRLGRIRRARWGPRIIDLDLVRYEGVAQESAALTLPHPGLPHRDFWQRELRELDRLMSEAA